MFIKIFSSLFIFVVIVFSQEDTKFSPVNEPSISTHIIQTPIENVRNLGYSLTVRIGDINNNNFFNLKLDTLSSEIWIPDITCENCRFANKYSRLYACDSNPTCIRDKNDTYKITYPSGYSLGYHGKELYSFDGLPLNTSINSSILFATKISNDFYNIQADGVFGLGLGINKTNDLLNYLYDQGLIKKKVFSLYLSHNYLGIDRHSELVFGGYKPDHLETNQPFQFAPLQEDSWSIKLKDVLIEDTSLSIKPSIAILSTIFPDIGVPSGFMDKILEIFSKKGIKCIKRGQYVNPLCQGTVDDVRKFPNITFMGNEVKLVLPPQAYITYVTMNKYENTKIVDGFNIVVGLREVRIPNETDRFVGKWIFGADFQRYFYVIYDQDNLQLGFAVAKNSWDQWKKSLLWVPAMFVGAAIFILFAFCVIIARFWTRRHKIEKKESSLLRYTQMVSFQGLD